MKNLRKFLYTLGSGSVSVYSVNSDGTLNQLGDIEGLSKTAGFNGMPRRLSGAEISGAKNALPASAGTNGITAY